jgi:hypothetical protein
MITAKLSAATLSPAAAGKAAAKARSSNGRRSVRPVQAELAPALEEGRRTTFLVGTPFSGSTLLGNCLNAHPSIFFAGEIARLTAFRRADDAVTEGEEGCRLCAARGEHECPAWPRDFSAALAPLADIARYRAILDHAKAPILVDSSKGVDWLNALHDAGLTAGVTAIICARNPFAVAHSRAQGEPRVNPTAAAIAWREFYVQAIRSLARRGIPSLVVRYETFAFDPAATLRRICDFLGLPVDPGMMTYWETPSHAIGGSGHAFVRDANFTAAALNEREADALSYFADKPFGGWVDDRWTQGLSDEEMRQIMAVPTLNDVAALLGYDLSWFIGERVRLMTERKLRDASRQRAANSPAAAPEAKAA